MTMDSLPHLLTPDQLGEMLQVSGGTIRQWHREGLIPARVAAGRIYRFDPEQVLEALAAHAERKQRGLHRLDRPALII
jgi:excisionase family DNA binding protein